MSDTESSPSSSLGSASGNGSNHSSPSSPQSPLGFQITTEPFFTTSWRPKHGKNIRDGRYITQLHMEPYSYTKDMPNLPWEKMCGDSSVTGVESLEEGQHMLMEESLGRRKMVIRFGNF